jgi:hypothetical protein
VGGEKLRIECLLRGWRQHLGFLSGVRVFVALVHFQLGHEHAAEPVFRNHAPNGVSDQFFRVAGPHLGDGSVFFATFPAGIGHELLVRLLLAGDKHLLGIDNDDKIAGIQVGGIDRLVLSTKDVGDLGGKAAQDGAVGINHMPFALVQIYFRQMRFHLRIPIKRGEKLSKKRGKSIGEIGILAV